MGLSRRAGLGILIGAYLAASTACTALVAREAREYGNYIAEKKSQNLQYSSLEEKAKARVEAMNRASESYKRLTPEEVALAIMGISRSVEEISP